MRCLAPLCLLTLLSLPAFGDDQYDTGPTGRRLDLTGKNSGIPRHPMVDGREGGETIGSAFVISGLPFNDSGATCDNVDNYDEACPYAGSTSPDVVYRYVPTSDVEVAIDLCASQYDTKVYVYEYPGASLVACNDDAGCGYSGFQSHIAYLQLTYPHAYYIVVDGYEGDCGTYVLNVEPQEPCDLVCPPGGIPEGEPPCVDGYYDIYNGGC